MDAREFYDEYVERQAAVGVNARHRAIAAALQRFGWRPGQRVLEIGCGIGTLTELLARNLGSAGRLLAVDLSPKSIAEARARLGAAVNVDFVAGDILELEVDGQFDVIVLPDVVEHIPLQHHPELFARVAAWLVDDGFALINYPNPNYLAWCHEHRPEVLQIIDQPIHADRLLADSYPSGLYLHYLETYSLWIYEGDYVLAVLRHRSASDLFTTIPQPKPSLLSRARRRLRGLIR